jgi:hypothetical protein
MEITCAGWLRLDEIKRQGIDTNRVFVAMWFDTEMETVRLKNSVYGGEPQKIYAILRRLV